MKAHIGVDADSGLTHTLITTPANTADVNIAHLLLHGKETVAFGDAGYPSVHKRAEHPGSRNLFSCGLRNRFNQCFPKGYRLTKPSGQFEQRHLTGDPAQA
jgi:IS5 family transposase